METYTDNEGRTVLERRIHTDTKGTEHLDTYYVYDDLNRLRYVLPPQAEEIFRQAGETRSGSDKGIADYAYAPCTTETSAASVGRQERNRSQEVTGLPTTDWTA